MNTQRDLYNQRERNLNIIFLSNSQFNACAFAATRHNQSDTDLSVLFLELLEIFPKNELFNISTLFRLCMAITSVCVCGVR
jgi:hypothetical protein